MSSLTLPIVIGQQYIRRDGLPIVIGQQYIRRDGLVVTVREAHPEFNTAVLFVGDGSLDNVGSNHAYRSTGRVYYSDRPDRDHANDLVADYEEKLRVDTSNVVLGKAEVHFDPAVPPSLTDYADILRGIADGKVIQYDNAPEDSNWCAVHSTNVLHDIALWQAGHPSLYRVKPDVIVVNGIEVPAPVRVAPAKGTLCYSVDTTEDDGVFRLAFYGDDHDLRALQFGLLHLSYEAAELHAKAMLAPSRIAA